MAFVKFNYADVEGVALRNKNKVKAFVQTLFSSEKKELKELNYIFCSDEYLLEINRTFLNHDYYTDIITFDLSEGDGTVGEVYISVTTVRDNAKNHNASFEEEMLRVIFHGALHLCGYRDKKKSEITLMREKEDYYLLLYWKN